MGGGPVRVMSVLCVSFGVAEVVVASASTQSIYMAFMVPQHQFRFLFLAALWSATAFDLYGGFQLRGLVKGTSRTEGLVLSVFKLCTTCGFEVCNTTVHH